MDSYIVFDPLTRTTIHSCESLQDARDYQTKIWNSTLTKYNTMPTLFFWNYFRPTIKYEHEVVDDGHDLLIPQTSSLITIYPYGSRIYGTLHKNSDYDFIVIMNDPPISEWTYEIININYYSPTQFQEAIDNHEIWALECLSTEPILSPLPDYNWKFILDLKKLRMSISKKSDESFHKGKQKLIKPYDNVEGELMRGKKSLFHSFRILMFGIQLAKHNKIVNFSEANDIFHEIMNINSDTWADYEYLKPKYNQLASQFRLLAPKI